MMKLAARHYVRPEHMNHHDSLYAGVLTNWMSEAAFFGVVEVLGRRDHVVMCAINDFRFCQPASLGTIIDMDWELEKVGTSSLTIAVKAYNMLDADQVFASCKVVFVNTDEHGKSAPHGIQA
ncbi:MAG: acyl-CoA thioesterase [Brotaphodocola sp.]